MSACRWLCSSLNRHTYPISLFCISSRAPAGGRSVSDDRQGQGAKRRSKGPPQAVGASAPRTSAVPTTTEAERGCAVPPYALCSSFAFQTANTSANEVLLMYIRSSSSVTMPLFIWCFCDHSGACTIIFSHEYSGRKALFFQGHGTVVLLHLICGLCLNNASQMPFKTVYAINRDLIICLRLFTWVWATFCICFLEYKLFDYAVLFKRVCYFLL